MTNRLIAALCACALAATAGCSLVETAISGGISSAASSAGSSAGQTVGNEAGNRAGNAAVNAAGGPTAPVAANPNLAALNGRMTMMYTQIIFSLAFSSGGYAIGSNDFKPGQYVRYRVIGEHDGVTIERGYLGDDAEGNQWWKVKMINPEKPADTVILEALLSPKDQKLQRLRGKFPSDTEGKEMPVTENQGYIPPTRLTKGSIDGATKGVETVTVPAGTFPGAKHVVFGDLGQTHEWWLADKVPGGTVKESTKGNGGSQAHTLELVAYGNDAQSELGTKLK
jgi:hypothetical protein